jgi:ABC-2 type transport system ATP-binding protein
MDEAERCSRVGLMYEGQIIVCDQPDKVKGLVSGDLIELRPANLRRAKEVIANLEGLLEVQTYGDLLHVFVDDASRRMLELASLLTAQGIAVEGLRQTRPRMEEAFISLIRAQATEE